MLAGASAKDKGDRMISKDSREEAVLMELADPLPPPQQKEDDPLSVPRFIEVELIASQRQLWRNTAVQARGMEAVAHGCGDQKGAEAWAGVLRDAVSHIVQLDAMFPEAKERMREMDDLANLVEKNRRAQKQVGA